MSAYYEPAIVLGGGNLYTKTSSLISMLLPSSELTERKGPIRILSGKIFWGYRGVSAQIGDQGNAGRKGTKAEWFSKKTPCTG